jgi:tetratricopeptide (TPR) repeat protein
VARLKIKKEGNKRRDNLDPSQDEFITKTVSVADWAYERRRPIALAIGLALAIAIIVIVVQRVSAANAAENSKVLAAGLDATLAPIVPPAEDPVPPETDEEDLSFENTESRAREALTRWQKVTQNAGSSIAEFGLLGEAVSHLDLKEYDKAIELYEKYLSKKSTGLSSVRLSAVEGLCFALEAKGKTEDARARLEPWLRDTQGVELSLVKYHLARFAIKSKDKEKATKLLQEIMTYFKEREKVSSLDYVFVRARQALLALNPNADVPDLPATGMGAFEGMDPELLQQLMRARQTRGGAGAS